MTGRSAEVELLVEGQQGSRVKQTDKVTMHPDGATRTRFEFYFSPPDVFLLLDTDDAP